MVSKKNEPVDARIRLAIADWPDDAPRGRVTAFCTEYGISRKTFYALRARARTDGQAAVMERQSRRPKTSPTKITDEVKDQAVAVRTALEASGWACGPINVHEKMPTVGLQPPSVASLARHQQSICVATLNKLGGRMKPLKGCRARLTTTSLRLRLSF